MVQKRILEWEDDDNDNESETTRTQYPSEDAIIEIKEISRTQGQLSTDSIIRTIPNSRLEESIRYHRSVIVQYEIELARRALDNEYITDEDYYKNVSDVGSLRFIDPEAYFTLGRPQKHNKKGRTSKSNRLATRRKPMAVKLSDFINKLTLTEDEKVNLLEEWRRITNGEI